MNLFKPIKVEPTETQFESPKDEYTENEPIKGSNQKISKKINLRRINGALKNKTPHKISTIEQEFKLFDATKVDFENDFERKVKSNRKINLSEDYPN